MAVRRRTEGICRRAVDWLAQFYLETRAGPSDAMEVSWAGAGTGPLFCLRGTAPVAEPGYILPPPPPPFPPPCSGLPAVSLGVEGEEGLPTWPAVLCAHPASDSTTKAAANHHRGVRARAPLTRLPR